MEVDAVPRAALVIYAVGLVLTFGFRTLQHYRRTGRSGWVGVSRKTGRPARFGAVAFAGALVVGVTGLVLAASGAVAALVVPAWVGVLGVVIAVAGVVVVFASQSAMGVAWRIGVDPSERTGLVTDGVFRWARNPIFTGMIATQVGVFLMVPSWLTGLAMVLLVAGIEVQVRGVEEPYLARAHGDHYREYRARVGRFLPGIGY
jgi:protein-S-isoprenylcysteine O-methyltransferase Ste14